MECLDYTSTAKDIYSQANRFYRLLPEKNYELLNFCDSLLKISPEYMKFISIWIKRRKLFDLEFLELYDRWLEDYIDNWALCDQYCYRVLNPTIERNFDKARSYVLSWSKSDKVFTNRAAIVCMIYSGSDFEVHLPLDFVFQIIDEIDHKHKYVNSAIGWILKYAYLKDREYVMIYILSKKFNATILNKVKEKMNDRDKEIIKNFKEDMSLKNILL